MEECAQWLDERMVAFPRLKRHPIVCQYARTPKNILGRGHCKIRVTRDVDPEAVLLEGKSGAVIRRKACGEFRITINENLGKIGHALLRKHVVRHTIIHERFNEIRTASGLPPVRSMADVEAAIHKIVDGIKL